MRSIAIFLVSGALAHGCAREQAPPPADQASYLSATDHLVRASMALRGMRPSRDDLLAVAADAGALEAIVDGYLQSDGFAETVRDMHNEVFLVRAAVRPDLFGFPDCSDPPPAGFECPVELQGRDVSASVQEAPLRLIEHIVRSDRPYTEIVTADYTVANDIVATVWGLDYDTAGSEWQVVHWADDRPHAGILSDSSLFNRYKSTESNANRGRANMISRALLCYDFASREVAVNGIDLADQDAVANALVSDPACASCHQALDPLASFFWGHEPFVVSGAQLLAYPAELYQLAWEDTWKSVTGRAPGFFGKAGQRLDDLGRLIAQDPRFSLCAVKRFYAYFNRVAVDDIPIEAAAELQRVFIDSGYSAKQLTRAIVLGDDFRTIDSADGLLGYKRARPEQLRRMIGDLTGFEWKLEQPTPLGTTGPALDLVTNAVDGFAVLAGGIDSFYTTQPLDTVNPTTTLFLRAYAAEAANHVVEHDASANPPILVTQLDATESVVRAQLVELHARLFGELVDDASDEVNATYQLFAAILSRSGDNERAWKVVLTAMLQDARILYY